MFKVEQKDGTNLDLWAVLHIRKKNQRTRERIFVNKNYTPYFLNHTDTL